MKSHAQAVVIGGGVTGCAVLYHLAKMGWTDVVLIERKELTSGSSWHAAGGLFALTSPSNVAALQKYTIELYPELEKESEQPVGFHLTGGFHLARTHEQVTALKLACSRGQRNGIEADFISLDEARRRSPILNTEKLEAVLWEPLKGYVDPASATNAFAIAARKMGATVYRHTPVIETNQTSDGGWEVVTEAGAIKTPVVVNAAGLWAREVAALAGTRLPLMPVEHHYLVTENVPEIEGFDGEIPTMTDSESGWYMRQEGQGILLGAYENTCYHWAEEGTPADFGHELLPDDLSRMEENFALAVETIPCLETAGIKRVINGPMIFSPDLSPLLGPYPGLKNYFCACGVMTGFNQGGGVGRVLAEWIVDGEPSLDIFGWDVSRFGDWAGTRYTRERTRYFYENRTQRVYPYQEFAAGRPVATSPVYETLAREGAVFGSNFGLEYPLWFARKGAEARDEYGYGRGNWFDTVGEECRAVRANAGLFEVSTFAKYEVTGEGAEDWLNLMMANRMPRTIGKAVLTPMLSPQGRLIGDFTVTRLAENRYWILGSGTVQRYHMRWFEQSLPPSGVQVENRTAQYAGLQIAGPQARALLGRVADADVGGNALPFLSGREMEVARAPGTIVVRVSYTGELGYELYCPAGYQRGLFDLLQEEGKDLGLRLAGSRALGSLRLEKSFLGWGLELGPDYSPFEAGLGRFVKLDKPDFIGQAAARQRSEEGPREHIGTFVVDADGADAFGGEAVFRDGELAGYVTSGGYGHCAGESLAMGYVKPEFFEPEAKFEIDILGERRAATLSAAARIDADGANMRS